MQQILDIAVLRDNSGNPGEAVYTLPGTKQPYCLRGVEAVLTGYVSDKSIQSLRGSETRLGTLAILTSEEMKLLKEAKKT